MDINDYRDQFHSLCSSFIGMIEGPIKIENEFSNIVSVEEGGRKVVAVGRRIDSPSSDVFPFGFSLVPMNFSLGTSR